ncbi:hypothetical protein [Anaerovorax sp. IOR16]|uniref:hypothetical protein n=1 Tax=Anaerovorax sp. IOR16 TaxID=2773458 RepID=UPI0019CF5B18|nr:hypothetical protein [Anaerovorax sp. IOR16]
MATQTKNYGLTKPDINDFYDVGIDNNNMDTIDIELKNLNDKALTAGDMSKSIYDKNNNGIVDNAEKVNGHTVEVDVPADAKFTDTITPIVNNLTETTPGKALDAMQGKILDEKIVEVNASLSAIEGLQTTQTVFNADDSITETKADGRTLTTTFNTDGTITEVLAVGETITTKTTTFNSDGSITEVIS